MYVTRLDEAEGYEAPLHHHMAALRLQGHDASPTKHFWIGLSHFLPGGGADASASQLERAYVVLEGEVTVIAGEDQTEVTLRRWDSVSFDPGESRVVVNRSALPCSMLVVMSYPPSAP